MWGGTRNGGVNTGGGVPEDWVPALEETVQDINSSPETRLVIEAEGRYILSTQVLLVTQSFS
jgi:hypothetical protein